MEPADNRQEGESVPKGGEQHPVLYCSPPSGTIGESRSTIRRLHSLRSFHQRLCTFAPFGDDWGEQVYYPQVTFPSVIPPAVMHIRPLRGRLGRAGLLSAGYIPFGHSTSGYAHSPPSGTIGESRATIRRLHSLRSFHQRLFTFAPFGDGRMLLAKLQLSSIIQSLFSTRKLLDAYGLAEGIH